MVSLTYTPPISSSVAAASVQTSDRQAVLGVLSTYAPGAIGESINQTLRNALGPAIS